MALIPINTFKTIDALRQMQLRPNTSLADIIEPLYDEERGQVRVWYYTNQDNYDKKNGKEIFKADTYLNGVAYISTAIPVGQKAEFQLCEGSTLVKFEASGAFPFYFKKTTANSYICTAKICNLVWVGLPKVSPAASESDTGRILVEAKSDVGGVEYWTEPFEYGAGAPSGEFFLLPGTYKIYAQDAQGCIISIGVEVPIGEPSETHFLKFFATYSNIGGEKTRIELLEKDYQGTPTQLGTQAGRPNPSSTPFVASWGKPGEPPNHPLKVSEATIKLISYVDYEFLGFFVNASQQYKVKIKRGDENGPLLWWGYITPEFYSEPYIHPPYEIQILCNDGLGDLQMIPWALVTIDYSPISFYTGRLTHLQVVVECLKKIGNELPIYTAINISEENMGYKDGPKTILHSFITAATATYNTLLQRGNEYLVKIKNNISINLYYAGVLIYEGGLPPTTLLNEDFSQDFRTIPGSWTQEANGYSSEVWSYIRSGAREAGSPDYLYNKAATINAGGPPKSQYLTQPYNFSAGGNYILDVKVYRESFNGTGSTYKLCVGVGNNKSEIEKVYDSGSLSATEPNLKTYHITFSPLANGKNFYFWFEFSMPASSWGKFYIDSIYLKGTPPTAGEVEFTYIPEVSTDLIKIEITSPGESTVEIWETIQDSFNQIYVDSENYISKEVMNCFDVLQEQLKPYAARMYQSGGAWHIVRFDQQNAPYLRHKYDKNGLYIESETYEPILAIKNPSQEQSNIWIHSNMNLEVLPGYRNITTVQDLGWVENYFINGDFPLEEFNEGVLRHFTSGFFKRTGIFVNNTPPNHYTRAQVGGDNYAVHISKFNIMPFLRVKGYIKGDTVPFGLPEGSPWMTGDAVLFERNHNSWFTGAYKAVSDDLWVYYGTKTSGYYKDWQLNGWYFRDYFTGKYWHITNLPPGIPTEGSPGAEVAVALIIVPVDNDYSDRFIDKISLSKHYWIKTMPRAITYDLNDLLVLEFEYVFQPNSFPGDYYINALLKVGDLYLQQDGSFSTQYDFVELQINPGREVSKTALTSSGFVGGQPLTELEVTCKFWLSQKPSINYVGSTINPSAEWANYIVDGNLDGLPEQIPPSLLIDSIKLVYLPGGQFPPLETVRIMSNSKKFHTVPSSLKLMHGDAPEVLNRDKIYSYYLTRSDGSPTSRWHRIGHFENKPLLDILTQILMRANLENTQKITGAVRNLLSFNDVIYDPQNPEKLFMINSISWDEMLRESNIELIEIEPIPQEIESAFTYGFSLGYES